MTKHGRKKLSPELWAKYQEWLRMQPGDSNLRYFRDGEFDTFKLNDAEQEAFDQWAEQAEASGEVGFETEDDDDEDNQLKWASKHITVINGYDLITRYLLDQRFVTKKREAWLIQAAVVVFVITVYVFWSIVF